MGDVGYSEADSKHVQIIENSQKVSLCILVP